MRLRARLTLAFTIVLGTFAIVVGASAEQTSGVGQVDEGVRQMDQATQQNAALVEESAGAADGLEGQAQHLVESVAVFKLAGAPALLAAPAANANIVHRPAFGRPAAAGQPVARAAATGAGRTGTDDRQTS